MNQSKYEFYFNIYLIILFIFSVTFLYQKHNVDVDWNISEWLINYQGGFTRRGLLGESALLISNLFNTSIRKVILLFQIISVGLYLILTFHLLKSIKKNYLLVFAIFSPVFLLYPIAELESLARKEIFLIISFIGLIYICSCEKLERYKYFYYLIITPILILIWEGIIFYIQFFLIVLIFKDLNKRKLSFFKLIIFNIPSLIAFYFVISKKLSPEEIKIMCQTLRECYGAILYLNNNLSDNINEVLTKIKLTYLIRYFIIIFFGFLPLAILIFISKLNKFKNQSLSKLYFVFIIIFIPSILFYIVAIDWGRWVNISYTLSFFTFVYLLKNKYIEINKNKLNIINQKINNHKNLLIFLFFLYAFCWNQKILINDKTGSLPLYRAIHKVYKISL
jgi:hypothetical protein